MALLVLSLSGCGSSSNTFIYDGGGETVTTPAEVFSIASPSLQRGATYKIFKGATLNNASGDPQIYIAPISNPESTQAALNLGFVNEFDGDTIVIANGDRVVFAYNPNGKGQDTTTEQVTFSGGTQLMYNGLTIPASYVSSSALTYDESKVINIVLNGSTATEDGSSIPTNNYVWHADPKHAAEYWTLGTDGTEELDEDEYLAAVTKSDNGVYIARDIRYMTSDLTFTSSQTAVKDEDKEYVVYYDTSSSVVSDEIADIVASKGSEFGGQYIFAALPMQFGGMGGGGTPPSNGGQFTPGSGDMSTPPDGGTPPDLPSGERPSLPGLSVSATTDSSIAAYKVMTHSASDAYNNPVLHITEPGTYRLSGKWHGQIWIDAGDDDDSSAVVTIILDGVEVSCDVAPALVFHDVYECGPDDETEVESNWKTLGTDTVTANAGARVIIADGTTNNFTGSNVYRIMKLEPKKDATKVNGTDIGDQKKMYKMDAAFYSFVSMVIGAESSTASGSLNVTSTTFEGLDAETHLVIDSGKISVTAPDDGINVNEDDISVFTMNGGTLSITSTGGDGIDSNGYVVINGGTLNLTAGNQQQNSAGEAGIDAEKDVEISNSAVINWTAAGGDQGGGTPPSDGGQQPGSGDVTPPSDGDTQGSYDTATYTDTEITTQYGTTDISFGASKVFDDDMSAIPRTVNESDTVFILESNREVNTFSGIREINQ